LDVKNSANASLTTTIAGRKATHSMFDVGRSMFNVHYFFLFFIIDELVKSSLMAMEKGP